MKLIIDITESCVNALKNDIEFHQKNTCVDKAIRAIADGVPAQEFLEKYIDIIRELNTEIEKSEQRDRDREISGLWGYSIDSMYSTEALKKKRQIYLEFIEDFKEL